MIISHSPARFSSPVFGEVLEVLLRSLFETVLFSFFETVFSELSILFLSPLFSSFSSFSAARMVNFAVGSFPSSKQAVRRCSPPACGQLHPRRGDTEGCLRHIFRSLPVRPRADLPDSSAQVSRDATASSNESLPFKVSFSAAAASVCSTAEYSDPVFSTARAAAGTNDAPSMIPSRTAPSFFTVIRFLCFFVIIIPLTESPTVTAKTFLIQGTAEVCQAKTDTLQQSPLLHLRYFYIYGISGRKVPLYLSG